MTTLERVQEAARAASRLVGGSARGAFLLFIDALEVEIEGEANEPTHEEKLASIRAKTERER